MGNKKKYQKTYLLCSDHKINKKLENQKNEVKKAQCSEEQQSQQLMKNKKPIIDSSMTSENNEYLIALKEKNIAYFEALLKNRDEEDDKKKEYINKMINEEVDGFTALTLAIEKNDLSLVQYIVENTNVHLNQQNAKGYTPIMAAAYFKAISVFHYLLSLNFIDDEKVMNNDNNNNDVVDINDKKENEKIELNNENNVNNVNNNNNDDEEEIININSDITDIESEEDAEWIKPKRRNNRNKLKKNERPPIHHNHVLNNNNNNNHNNHNNDNKNNVEPTNQQKKYKKDTRNSAERLVDKLIGYNTNNDQYRFPLIGKKVLPLHQFKVKLHFVNHSNETLFEIAKLRADPTILKMIFDFGVHYFILCENTKSKKQKTNNMTSPIPTSVQNDVINNNDFVEDFGKYEINPSISHNLMFYCYEKLIPFSCLQKVPSHLLQPCFHQKKYYYHLEKEVTIFELLIFNFLFGGRLRKDSAFSELTRKVPQSHYFKEAIIDLIHLNYPFPLYDNEADETILHQIFTKYKTTSYMNTEITKTFLSVLTNNFNIPKNKRNANSESAYDLAIKKMSRTDASYLRVPLDDHKYYDHPNEKGDCSICFSENTIIYNLTNCGHGFCVDCLRHYFNDKLRVEFTCPSSKSSCSQVIDFFDIQMIASKDIIDQISDRLTERACNSMFGFKWCSFCSNGQWRDIKFNERRKGSDNVIICWRTTCDHCKTTSCHLCNKKLVFKPTNAKRTSHSNHQNQRDDNNGKKNTMIRKELTEEELFYQRHYKRCVKINESNYLNFFSKKCPNCNTQIEHDGLGCSHMTCYVCKFEFCYICLRKYSGSVVFDLSSNKCNCEDYERGHSNIEIAEIWQ